MEFYDKVEIKGTRITKDGYLVASVRCARIGIQTYRGDEVGSDKPVVRVYRPPEEVFNDEAKASVAYKPVTNDHPSELVDASNWRVHAVGLAGGEVADDKQFLYVPLTLMDQAAINDVQAGKRELSAGYTCDFEFVDGKTADGEEYDAIQRNIRINHLAIVSAGRAGPNCRIGDTRARGDQDMPGDKPMKNVTVDGLTIETTDQGAQVIEKLMRQLADSNKALTDANTAHTTAIAAKDKELGQRDAEIEKLKKNQVDDSKLDNLVAARTAVIDRARIIAPDLKFTGLSISDIRRQAVTEKVGEDKVKGRSDDYVEALFDALAETHDAVRDHVRDTGNDNPPRFTDTRSQASAYDSMVDNLGERWKAPKKEVA